MLRTNIKLVRWIHDSETTNKEIAGRMKMPYLLFRLKLAGLVSWNLTDMVNLVKVTGANFEDLF